jgi:beta-lactamase class C
MNKRSLRIVLFVAGLITLIVFVLILRTENRHPVVFKKKNNKNKRTYAYGTSNPYLKQVFADYEQELDMLQMVSGIPGAAIAVVKDSSIVFVKTIGVKEVGTRDSINAHTVFRIASVSKCFASFLTGILVQDSLLHWNDNIVRYMPDFTLKSPEQTQKLTIHNVLSHTTGLPFHAYTNLVEEGQLIKDMLARLKEVNMVGNVGEVYSYQNVAYSLIGEVIEIATKKSYQRWMIDSVFRPLDMRDASIDYFSMITNTNIAKPHVMRHKSWKTASITNTYYNVAPAGGINASITDMAHWMIALLGYRPDVIHPDILQQLYTPAIHAPSKNRNYGKFARISRSYYGLGWRILHFPSDTIVYHGGYVNGYRSEVAVSKKDNIAICILANAPGELPDNGIPIFLHLLSQKRDSIAWWEEQHHRLPSAKHPGTGH